MLVVTAASVSVAVVTAGETLFQVVPPSVLTCQLYDKPVPVAVAEKLALVPAHTVEAAGWAVIFMLLVETVSVAALELVPDPPEQPLVDITHRYW